MTDKHTFCDELAMVVDDYLAGNVTLSGLRHAVEGYHSASRVEREQPGWQDTLALRGQPLGEPHEGGLMSPKRQQARYGAGGYTSHGSGGTPSPRGSFPNREHLQVGPRIGGLDYQSPYPEAKPICHGPHGEVRCEDCRCGIDHWEKRDDHFIAVDHMSRRLKHVPIYRATGPQQKG